MRQRSLQVVNRRMAQSKAALRRHRVEELVHKRLKPHLRRKTELELDKAILAVT